MKKLLLIPFLLLVVKLQAQKHAAFKIKYKPNHTYSGDMGIKMELNATLSGNDTVLQKLAAQGIKQPVAFNFNLVMSGITQAGSPGSDGNFPLTMSYNFKDISANLGGNEVPIPKDKLEKGIKVYGHCSADGVFQTDSAAGQKMNDSARMKTNRMMNAFQKNIKFPDHPMKIGESFTQSIPFNLPMTGTNFQIDASTVYTLLSISDGKAYFDVKPNINMSIPVKGNVLTVTGTGSGKMTYSIKDNFATDYTSTINLKVNGKIATLQIDATAQMDINYAYTVAAN